MRFWAQALRILGALWFVWTIINQLRQLFGGTNVIGGAGWWLISGLLQAAVFSGLCFGVASGLESLARMDERISRRSTLPDKKPPVRRSIAPVAPQNWKEFNPRPPESEKDTLYEQRLAQRWRYRVKPKKRL